MAPSLFLFLVVTRLFQEIGASQSFYSAEYQDFRCPISRTKFEDCILEYKECVGRERPSDECDQEVCSCARFIENDNSTRESSDCRNISSVPCLLVIDPLRSHVFREDVQKKSRKEVINKIKSRFEIVRGPIEHLTNECGMNLKSATENIKLEKSEDLKFLLPLFILKDAELTNSQKCREAITHFETSLKKMDEVSSSKLKFAYDFWWLGAEFGPSGRVGMRMIAAEACGKKSLDFNMDASVFVNCYDSREEKIKCDGAYFESLDTNLSHMGGDKVKCRMLVELVKDLFPTRSDKFHDEAWNYYRGGSKVVEMDSVGMDFEGFLGGNMAARDTRNDDFRLPVQEKRQYVARQLFRNVSRECGNVKSIVTLCGYMYCHCKLNQQENCTTNLLHCLQKIDDLEGSCHEAITKLSRHLEPSTSPKVSDVGSQVSSVAVETSSRARMPTVLLAVAVAISVTFLVLLVFFFNVFRIKTSRAPSTAPSSEENLPMIERQSAPEIGTGMPDVIREAVETPRAAEHEEDDSLDSEPDVNIPVIPTGNLDPPTIRTERFDNNESPGNNHNLDID